MKRLACLFTITIFFFSCEKSMNEFDQLSSSSAKNNLKSKNGRIEVCHYDKETGTSHPITINENGWAAHQKHGDVLGNCSIESVTICDQTWMLKNSYHRKERLMESSAMVHPGRKRVCQLRRVRAKVGAGALSSRGVAWRVGRIRK